jgi:hypothetical protein
MAGGKIVAGFFLWVLKIRDYGQVDHGRPLTNDEGLVREMSFQDAKEIIKPVFKKLEYIWIGRRCKSALEAVRCHIARQFVIIPEQPTQNFKLLPLVSTGEASMALRKAEQERRRLREACPSSSRTGISPISLTVERHSGVLVAPPPKSVQMGSNV